ncbi:MULTISPECIES: tetratricopeptide repeat protein [Cyanophyceae]|uniref:tetratricopeptide repeat protein n=1 Tax=Cyanophyceae TaxID=3028117 RepID=UPI00168321B7|nr:tetratricopeptide repeat protein [Trichocoleus sp. FACHB-69]MBD1932592.1 tetratricopeptide repeat protein [Trichocoleus sp. FACHB-69]
MPNPAEITAFTGTVEIKRNGQQSWEQVSVGTKIVLGTLLRKKSGATVKIRCGNGTPSEPVPDDLLVGLRYICPTQVMSPGDPRIPYIISPRDTLILTDTPILRWNAAADASSFTVTVRGRELEWAKQVSREEVCHDNRCEFVYPGEPPLQPDVSYKLVVEADTGRNSNEETALGFKLIDAEQAETVQALAQNIQEQDLSDLLKALALANLYADQNLVALAIETLEAFIKDVEAAGVFNQPAELSAVYTQLGELYRWIGLFREAEVQYQKLVALAEVEVGEVRWSLGKRKEAIDSLEKAKAIYEELRDKQRVSELEERLTEMNG